MQHSYLKVFTRDPTQNEDENMIIPFIDDIEILDFILVIKGSLLLEYNETDPETLEERIKLLSQHTGYIHPIRTPENQNAKCLKISP
jgi:hypothetical protein